MLIVGIATVAETKPEHKPVKTIMDIAGWLWNIPIAICGRRHRRISGVCRYGEPKRVLLPIILTILLVPYLYVLTVYMAYESIFNRLEWFLRRKKKLVGYAKRQVFRTCLLRISKVKRFSGPAAELGGAESRADVIRIVRLFDAVVEPLIARRDQPELRCVAASPTRASSIQATR